MFYLTATLLRWLLWLCQPVIHTAHFQRALTTLLVHQQLVLPFIFVYSLL